MCMYENNYINEYKYNKLNPYSYNEYIIIKK